MKEQPRAIRAFVLDHPRGHPVKWGETRNALSQPECGFVLVSVNEGGLETVPQTFGA